MDTSNKLEDCLGYTSVWMCANMLMLSQEKKEPIIFKPNYQLKLSDIIQLQVEEDNDFYTFLIKETQVNAVWGACYYHIHNSSHIR